MHMDMKYTLTRSLANVHAYIIPVRMELLINNTFYAISE